MGFKSVLKKIGKVALTAAPYVAAPFTGGASLAATGLANKAVQKWSESDAKKAIAKGLAPSSFDRILGKVGTIGSLATAVMPTNALGSIGLLGKAAQAGKVAGDVGKVANAVSGTSKVAGIGSKLGEALKIAGPAFGALSTVDTMRGQAQDKVGQNTGTATQRAGIGPTSSVMPRGGYRYNENPINQMDQSMPNMAGSIFQGRQEATMGGRPYNNPYQAPNEILPGNTYGLNPGGTLQPPSGGLFSASTARKRRAA